MGMKKIIDNYKRNKALKIITYDLGRIEETDDAIYCYVDSDKFKNMNSLLINSRIGIRMGFAEVFGHPYIINKDIVFVFDRITFEKRLDISIPHSIKISNCIFNECVSVSGVKDIEFDSNICNPNRKVDIFIEGKTENVKFINNFFGYSCYNYIFIDNCEKIEMIDTAFNCIAFTANVDNFIMKDSNICSDSLQITSDEVNMLGSSSINCSDNAILRVDKCNNFSNINANDVIYNGYNLSEYGNYSYIDDLREQRQKLVNTLAMIKKMEDDYQKFDVKKYSDELKGRPLSRRLEKL